MAKYTDEELIAVGWIRKDDRDWEHPYAQGLRFACGSGYIVAFESFAQTEGSQVTEPAPEKPKRKP